jgi:hypothetical protein
MASSPPRLAPSVSIDEIGERDTATDPNRQQDIGVDAGRQAECPLNFLLEAQRHVLSRTITGRRVIRQYPASAASSWLESHLSFEV